MMVFTERQFCFHGSKVMMTKYSVTRTGARSNMTNRSILLLVESRAKWTVLWWAPGDVMSSLNIPVWWWTGSFSSVPPLSIIKPPHLVSSATPDRSKNSTRVFAITLLSVRSICHMSVLGLISALAPWQPRSLPRSAPPQWQDFSCCPPHLYKLRNVVWQCT